MKVFCSVLYEVCCCICRLLKQGLYSLTHVEEEAAIRQLATHMVSAARRNKMARICIRYPFRTHDLFLNRNGLMDKLKLAIEEAGGDSTHMGFFGARKIYLNTIPAWLYDPASFPAAEEERVPQEHLASHL